MWLTAADGGELLKLKSLRDSPLPPITPVTPKSSARPPVFSPTMPVTAPFNPPSPDLPGKPYVRPWDAPPITKETHNFAQLTSIDLGKMDSDDPKVVAEVVEEIKVAIRDDGFIFLENYGVSQEQVRRACPDGLLVNLVLTPFFLSTLLPAQSPVCPGPVPLRQHLGGGQGSAAVRPGHRPLVGLQAPLRFQAKGRPDRRHPAVQLGASDNVEESNSSLWLMTDLAETVPSRVGEPYFHPDLPASLHGRDRGLLQRASGPAS